MNESHVAIAPRTSRLLTRLGLSPLVVGLVYISFITSLPSVAMRRVLASSSSFVGCGRQLFDEC